jgi:hypothetical protein
MSTNESNYNFLSSFWDRDDDDDIDMEDNDGDGADNDPAMDRRAFDKRH